MNVGSIGILGLGSIGRRHARNARLLGRRVVGFDPSPEAHSWFREEFHQEVVERAQLFAESEAIIIASPNEYHLGDLGEAIDERKPVLVEKPLGHDDTLARKIVERAGKQHLLIAAAQNLRFRKVVQRARGLLGSGVIGSPLWAQFICGSWLPDWRPGTDYRLGYAANELTGGVLFDVIHEFDLAVHLLGPADVRAAIAKRSGLLEIQSEDIADVVMQHEGGCQTTVHVDYVTRPRRRELRVSGAGGVLNANLHSGELDVRDVDGAQLIAEIHQPDPDNEYLNELRDFIDASETKSKPACSGWEAVMVLELVCKARQLAGLPQPMDHLAS